MRLSSLCTYGVILANLLAPHAFSYQLPPEQILRNNLEHRKYLKGMEIHQKIDFFNDPQISCSESIYFKDPTSLRIDYRCGHHQYTLLQHDNKRVAIYNKQVHALQSRPIHYLLALFLFREPEALFESMSYDRFITAEKGVPESLESEPTAEIKKPEAPSKKEWRVQADVSLVRLNAIELGHHKKMEKNVCFLLISPVDSDRRIWFEKDIFLPQQIYANGKKIIFKNYTEISDDDKNHPHFFKYPQGIELLDNDTLAWVIEPQLNQFKINPVFDSDFFSAKKITSSQTEPFPEDSPVKTTLENFIAGFR